LQSAEFVWRINTFKGSRNWQLISDNRLPCFSMFSVSVFTSCARTKKTDRIFLEPATSSANSLERRDVFASASGTRFALHQQGRKRHRWRRRAEAGKIIGRRRFESPSRVWRTTQSALSQNEGRRPYETSRSYRYCLDSARHRRVVLQSNNRQEKKQSEPA